MWKYEDSRSVSLAWFLIAAALFHASLWQASRQGLLTLPDAFTAFRAPPPAPIEIEKFNSEAESLPVVKTDQVEFDKRLLKEKKARFAGEFDNRVEQETRSGKTGRFLPGAGDLLRQRARALAERNQTKPVEGTDDGEIPRSDLVDGGQAKGLGMSDLMAYGASPNKFPSDVSLGANTLLNTDKVKYASYINRIADDVYDPWVGYAQDAASVLKDRAKKMDDDTYVTRLSVTLNEEGVVTGLTVIKSSGIDVFDEATKKAFYTANPFPNPPAQLFNEQRRIKLVYEFHFEWKSSFYGVYPRRI